MYNEPVAQPQNFIWGLKYTNSGAYFSYSCKKSNLTGPFFRHRIAFTVHSGLNESVFTILGIKSFTMISILTCPAEKNKFSNYIRLLKTINKLKMTYVCVLKYDVIYDIFWQNFLDKI